MTDKLHVIFCLEAGILEEQAKLLISSAHQWLEPDSYVLHAYSPRTQNHPSAQTLTFIDSQGVNWISEPLNKAFDDYPIANKILACKHFSESHKAEKNIMFVDTDTIFLNPIPAALLSASPRLLLRPVDNKGPGTESISDPNDEFWQQIFARCEVAVPENTIKTTVGGVAIRNYFNAGLVWSQGLAEFFQQWYEDFMTILQSELRPFGYLSRDGDDFRCLDQVALAVTATRYQQHFEVLPETYNYPLPFKPAMQARPGHPKLDDLIHVHYHKWFQHPGFLNHVTSQQEISSNQFRWLQEKLPIKPEIDIPFKF